VVAISTKKILPAEGKRRKESSPASLKKPLSSMSEGVPREVPTHRKKTLFG